MNSIETALAMLNPHSLDKKTELNKQALITEKILSTGRYSNMENIKHL